MNSLTNTKQHLSLSQIIKATMYHHSTQRRLQARLLLSLTILSLLMATVHPVAPSPSTTEFAATEYIRTSCTSTLYPAICFSSLSRFAASVHQDPARLAQAAIYVSLFRTRKAASFVSTLSDPSTSTLHDCFSVLRDASSRISDSLTQLKQISAADSSTRYTEEFRFWVSNVQTWMSAALTDDETCTDGFGSGPAGGSGSGSGSTIVKAEVFGRVDKVKKVTSNALALFDQAYAAN